MLSSLLREVSIDERDHVALEGRDEREEGRREAVRALSGLEADVLAPGQSRSTRQMTMSKRCCLKVLMCTNLR